MALVVAIGCGGSGGGVEARAPFPSGAPGPDPGPRSTLAAATAPTANGLGPEAMTGALVEVRFSAGPGWTAALDGPGGELRAAFEDGSASFEAVAPGAYELTAESLADAPRTTTAEGVTLIPAGTILRLGTVDVGRAGPVIVDCTPEASCTGVR
ncbi:MAG: hypothetical protein ACT4PW_02770 [Acidimicrobiia bacterium]